LKLLRGSENVVEYIGKTVHDKH